MMRCKLLVLLLLSLVFESTSAVCQTNSTPFAINKKTYVINSMVDLQGQTVTIPSGSVVVFKKRGMVKNGTLEGDGVTVKAGRRQIFHHVVLKGDFSAKIAYSEWFDIKDDCVLDSTNKLVSGTNNLQAFKNLFRFNNVSIRKGIYLIEGGVLSCRSNQVINGNYATLKFLTKKYCINIEGSEKGPVKDVEIRNLIVIGCKNELDDKTQWWHGVNIGYANNILVEAVTCVECRGDGFCIGNYIYPEHDELIPENITLNKIKAIHNYRNGLSITRAINVNVTNSEFCHTSGTLPEAGIDIEPDKVIKDKNILNVGELENINITNCKFHGNNNEGLLIANQISTKPSIRIIKNIHVADCYFEDDDITVTGCEDCTFERFDMKNSKVKINGESIIKNLTLTGFNMVETEDGNDETAIDLQYYRSKDWPVRSNIVISDMKIDGYGGAAITVGQGNLITYKKFDGLTISGCSIKNCGKGIKIGKSVKNLHFYNNTVDGKPVASDSVQLMGISLFVFSLLATGGVAYFMKKKRTV